MEIIGIIKEMIQYQYARDLGKHILLIWASLLCIGLGTLMVPAGAFAFVLFIKEYNNPKMAFLSVAIAIVSIAILRKFWHVLEHWDESFKKSIQKKLEANGGKPY